MMAKILDGNLISNKIKNKIATKINYYCFKKYRVPSLAMILVGNNYASKLYLKNKLKACKYVGLKSYYFKLPYTISEYELLLLINKLNLNKKIDGILLQLPLPINFKKINFFDKILPNKDVDGFNPYNIGRLFNKEPFLKPCTSSGIMTLLKKYKINILGLNAVIVGSSIIVGKPMFLELLLSGCTVTITHKFTKNLKNHIKNADLLIVAIGKVGLINSKWIKPGAIVIDVGINILKNGKLVGDIDYQSVLKKASYITPVPGGVGPMTVVTLLQNTLKAYKNHLKYKI